MQHQVLPPLPLRADERATLVAFLDHYRATLVDRACGLSDEQLRYRHPPSSLTLARLIGHMVLVEQIWIPHRLEGAPESEPYASLDFVADSRMRIDRAPSLETLTVGTNASGER